MANATLFQSIKSHFSRNKADTVNEAGGPAYTLPPKVALAQLAATGCFNGTFYTQADEQLETLLTLIKQVDDNIFLAKLALYSREKAFMKDMPAALLAALAGRDVAIFHRLFDHIVDNGRLLRTLFQMIRSGKFGKKSLTTSVQRAFRRWLNQASVDKLLSASIGTAPSLRDILRMARPKPTDNTRRAFFGWLTEKELAKWAPATETDLPEQVQLLKQFRAAATADEQLVILEKLHARWDLLADSAKGYLVWSAMAKAMGPQALRMNLNTLQRHGIFSDEVMVDYVADHLSDAEEIRRARQFPYQYFAAYMNASSEMPAKVKTALHQAAEFACGNVPELQGPIVIGLDVSGSMSSPITGHRGTGGTSKMRCVDVAALFAAALLRRNPESVVIPFDTAAYEAKMDPSDSILSLADRLAKFGGGGTDCSLPISHVLKRYPHRKFAGIALVSDNESWVYQGRALAYGARQQTGVMTEWSKFVKNQVTLQGGNIPGPKLICIDLQPHVTTQAPERSDILNVGGFSDAVFKVMAAFMNDDVNRFVTEIEAISLDD